MKVDFSQKNFLRDCIGNYMLELGRREERVVIVNADLMGTCRTRSFVERYPGRAFNVGIAEQNMVSFAAGLAHEGYIPYAFSMAPFITMRACEQCRTDVAYGRLNVRLMGTYAGCSGGISGATHWGGEDCAIMCGIPEILVLEPCDAIQAKKMLDATLLYKGPVYIRSSVEPMIQIYEEADEYRIGQATIVRDGDAGAFLCAGITVKFALEAARHIEDNTGQQIRVVDMHTIKPIDRKAVLDAAKTGRIVAAHDHNIVGGLGTQVAQVLAEEGIGVSFANIGIPDQFVAMAHAAYLYHGFGYDTMGLEYKMMEFLEKE